MANPLNAAKKVVETQSSGGQSDLNEEMKETVKQAIYELRDEEREGAQSSPGSNVGRLALVGLGIAIGRRLGKMESGSDLTPFQSGEATKIDVQDGEPERRPTPERSGGSSESGSGFLGKMVTLAGLGAVAYAVYRRRQSKQSATHIEHTGNVTHADESDLPEAETGPNDPEVPQTSEPAETGSTGGRESSDGSDTVGVDEDVVAPDPDESDSESGADTDEETEEAEQ